MRCCGPCVLALILPGCFAQKVTIAQSGRSVAWDDFNEHDVSKHLSTAVRRCDATS
jgi:hypothetical protein